MSLRVSVPEIESPRENLLVYTLRESGVQDMLMAVVTERENALAG
jgi:hypothetical protein